MQSFWGVIFDFEVSSFSTSFVLCKFKKNGSGSSTVGGTNCPFQRIITSWIVLVAAVVVRQKICRRNARKYAVRLTYLLKGAKVKGECNPMMCMQEYKDHVIACLVHLRLEHRSSKSISDFSFASSHNSEKLQIQKSKRAKTQSVCAVYTMKRSDSHVAHLPCLPLPQIFSLQSCHDVHTCIHPCLCRFSLG
jgi:hypothetical protein